MAETVVKKFVVQFSLTGKQAQKALSSIQKDFQKIQKTARATNGVFGKLFGIASVAGFTKITNDSAKFAHSMTVLARETGIAGQKLRDMRSAFNAIAGTGETAIKTVERIQQGLARTFYGDSSMANQLRSMGIDAFKNGVMRDATDIMGDIADWIVKKNQSGTDERVIRQYLKDRFGIDDSQFEAMKGGREAYLQKIAEETSAINDEQTKALDELNQSLNKLKDSIENSLVKAIAEIAPYLRAIAEKVANFVKDNPEVTTAVAGLGGLWGLSKLKNLFTGGGKVATAGAGARASAGFSLFNTAAGLFFAKTIADSVGYGIEMANKGIEDTVEKYEKNPKWYDIVGGFMELGAEAGRRVPVAEPRTQQQIRKDLELSELQKEQTAYNNGQSREETFENLKEIYKRFHPDWRGRAPAEYARKYTTQWYDENTEAVYKSRGWGNLEKASGFETLSLAKGNDVELNIYNNGVGNMTDAQAEDVKTMIQNSLNQAQSSGGE
jgi:ElaB/YqjD/DUF883 family membrane-anchored ribosome-binding protein